MNQRTNPGPFVGYRAGKTYDSQERFLHYAEWVVISTIGLLPKW
jgi:hypothetical protein